MLCAQLDYEDAPRVQCDVRVIIEFRAMLDALPFDGARAGARQLKQSGVDAGVCVGGVNHLGCFDHLPAP